MDTSCETRRSIAARKETEKQISASFFIGSCGCINNSYRGDTLFQRERETIFERQLEYLIRNEATFVSVVHLVPVGE